MFKIKKPLVMISLNLNKKIVKINDIVKLNIIITNNTKLLVNNLNVLPILPIGLSFLSNIIKINKTTTIITSLINLNIFPKDFINIEIKVKVTSDLIPILVNIINADYNLGLSKKKYLITSNLGYIIVNKSN
ncbi:MAG: hypothetical protein RSF67_09265 [Clostridia bacterium]